MSALLSGGEVVSVHIGAAGANVAATFWQIIAKEHHLVTSQHVKKAQKELLNKRNGRRAQSKKSFEKPHSSISHEEPDNYYSQNLGAFFQETLDRYVPRAVFVDSDPSTRYSGLFEPLSPLKHFFRPENFAFGTAGSSGVRATAISQGMPEARRTIESLLREFERCDSPQGVQLTHHIGGGSGAGLGCLISKMIKDEFGRKIPIIPMTLLPSVEDIGRRNGALEIYNAVLSLPDLATSADVICLADNEALFDICLRLVAVSEPGWRDLNHIIASVMSGLTSCMRFADQRNNAISRLHFRELPSILNQTGFETVPFVIPGFTPLTNRAANAPLGALLKSALLDSSSSATSESSSDSMKRGRRVRFGATRGKRLQYRKAGSRMPTASELCQSLFKPCNMLASADTLGHFYTSALAVFRGQITPNEIDQEINYTRLSGQDRYKEWSQWMPNNLTCRFCPEPETTLKMSSSWLGKTTAVRTILHNLMKHYELQLTKKAFTHMYLEAGMEFDEFYEKLEGIQYLIEQYDILYLECLEKRFDRLTDYQHMGDLPYELDLATSAAGIFDVNRPITLNF